MSKQNQLTTPPGIVIKVEKRAPYSVINITDINAYRQERHEYEIAWEKKYVEKQAAVRSLVHDLVVEQSKDLTFSEHEKAEIAYRAYRDALPAKRTERHLEFLRAADADKLMRERNEFIRSEHDRKHGSLSQRFSNLVTKLMKSGFGW